MKCQNRLKVTELQFCFGVRQCDNFNGLSPLTRGLDLLTKTKVKDDLEVKGNVTSTANCNDDDDDEAAGEFSSFAFWRQPLPSVDLDDIAAILASRCNFRHVFSRSVCIYHYFVTLNPHATRFATLASA